MAERCLRPDQAYARITQVLGCKWSVLILDAISRGVCRPGRISREIEGLPVRVMHRCMTRLTKDGLISKETLAEKPLHVEYGLTEQGRQFLAVVEAVRNLSESWQGSQGVVRTRSSEPQPHLSK
jgi:DNA-binding HxlR family transcriptional regulator